MLDFFGTMYQQGQISGAQSAASRAHTEAQRARGDAARDVRDLEARLDSLTLTTMAMWSLLGERLGITEDELAARVRELDLRDGRLDGRYTAPPAVCAECGRTFAAKRDRCIYCGGMPRSG